MKEEVMKYHKECREDYFYEDSNYLENFAPLYVVTDSLQELDSLDEKSHTFFNNYQSRYIITELLYNDDNVSYFPETS